MAEPRVSAHQDNFMALRLAAAILVIYGHAFPLTGATAPGFLGNSVQTIAVKIFFVISGYMISLSWERDPHFIRYFMRRALRIFPALIVVCLFSVLLVGSVFTTLPLSEYLSDPRTGQYFENIVLKPNYFLPGMFSDLVYPIAVNGSLWTLPVEFFMYITTPLILILGRTPLIASAFVTSCLSLYFSRFAIPDQPLVFWGTNVISALEMFPYFLIGAVIQVFSLKRFLSVQVALVVMFVAPLLVSNWTSSEAVALFVIPFVTLPFGLAPMPAFSSLSHFGDISYGMYLYGFLIQQCVSSVVGSDGNQMLNFAISTILALGLAMLSWRWVEAPALNWKPSSRHKTQSSP